MLATKDIADFTALHWEWQSTGRQHAGIIACRELPIGRSIEYLGRATRLLTAQTAANQLMVLEMFRTEAAGVAYVASLLP